MQSPTLTNVKLRSTDDALKIFHAVALKRLPMIARRLGITERREIRNGNIYVWEERNAASSPDGFGIERWTDGNQYTPSRIRDEFLVYVAQDPAPLPRAVDSAEVVRFEVNKMIKQTYSVYLAKSNPRKKWHIVAYYIPADLSQLVTVDRVPVLYSLSVPPGTYLPARFCRPGASTHALSRVARSLSKSGSTSSDSGDSRDQAVHLTSPDQSRTQTQLVASPAPASTLPPLSLSDGEGALMALSFPSHPPSHAVGGEPPAVPNMVPLTILQQSSQQTSFRNVEDYNMLKRFPSSSG